MKTRWGISLSANEWEFCFMFHAPCSSTTRLFVCIFIGLVSQLVQCHRYCNDFGFPRNCQVISLTFDLFNWQFCIRGCCTFRYFVTKISYNQNFAFADYCCATQTRSQLCNFQFLSCDMRCVFIVQLLASNYSLSFNNPFPGVCDVNPINWIFGRGKNCFLLWNENCKIVQVDHNKWGKLKRNEKLHKTKTPQVNRKLIIWLQDDERNKFKTETLRSCCVFSITSKYFNKCYV